MEFKKHNRSIYGKGRKNMTKTEREANSKRLLNTENKLRVAGGELCGGCVKWLMGVTEGTFGMSTGRHM